jgi:hypothetical protein
METLFLISPYESPIAYGPDGSFQIIIQMKSAADQITLEATDHEGNKEKKTAPKCLVHPPVINALMLHVDSAPPTTVTVSGRGLFSKHMTPKDIRQSMRYRGILRLGLLSRLSRSLLWIPVPHLIL